MKDEYTIGISRRKVLAGLGAVGVASAGAGFGTTAYFSDEESFEGNTLTAGQLDLSVTWQQLYYGGPQSSRSQDYGAAMRPFVNAYPDHDGDGVQSFEREDGTVVDEYAELDGDETETERETAAKEGRNLEFACAEIETFDDPSFAPNDESLIELDDVKPGDCGEVTFGVKLCDNPGYIWLHGDLTAEGDGGHEESAGAQLADEILARAWYDLDGDNVYDEGEPQIAGGTLRDVLEELNEGALLTYLPEVGEVDLEGEDPTEEYLDGECVELTKIDGDNIDDYVSGLDDPNDLEGGEVFVFAGEGPDGDDVEITIEAVILEDGDVIGFDWSSSHAICSLDMKGGNDSLTTAYVCETSGTAFTPLNGNNARRERYGLSNFTFHYCVPGDDNGTVPIQENGGRCFQPSNTRFVGFEWCLPVSVGNEVQGDSVAFDLSFYTEQCRHNPDPVNPFAEPDGETDDGDETGDGGGE
ncbi:MAG: SipW-dependent-type signal peptide-containing protein [Haloferacaceae archaeon]